MDLIDKLKKSLGGNAQTLAKLRITRQSISLWRKHGPMAGSVRKLLNIEKITSGAVTAEDIISDARARMRRRKP